MYEQLLASYADAKVGSNAAFTSAERQVLFERTR